MSAFPLVHDVLEEVTCSDRSVVAVENDEVASKTKEVVFELLAKPPNSLSTYISLNELFVLQLAFIWIFLCLPFHYISSPLQHRPLILMLVTSFVAASN